MIHITDVEKKARKKIKDGRTVFSLQWVKLNSGEVGHVSNAVLASSWNNNDSSVWPTHWRIKNIENNQVITLYRSLIINYCGEEVML